VAQALLHLDLTDGYWKMYSVVIQLGAILSLPLYFRSRIARFVLSYPKGDRGDRGVLTHPLGLTTVAFVVTAIPTILLTKVIGRHLESLHVMGWSLVVGGIVMWAVDVAVGGGEPGSGGSARVRTRSMEDMSLAQAAWVGACQVVAAVFPGTSRSMATIAGGQLAGMSRLAALEFSFFLSMPTMALATGYDLLKSTVGGDENPIGVTQIDAHGWAVLATGLVVSFIVAYASVAWLMTWVRRHGFVPFAIYRVVVGVLVLLWASGFLGSETQSLRSRRALDQGQFFLAKACSNGIGDPAVMSAVRCPESLRTRTLYSSQSLTDDRRIGRRIATAGICATALLATANIV
jgi:undecaprenyl-diphosphatase